MPYFSGLEGGGTHIVTRIELRDLVLLVNPNNE